MLWKNNQFFTDIPFPKVKDRPLIVAHPGAHMNYLASWNVMVDNEAPFVLVCDDLSPAYPDGDSDRVRLSGFNVSNRCRRCWYGQDLHHDASGAPAMG